MVVADRGCCINHRASVNAKIKAQKRPRLKIRECSRTRKCCPHAATFPNPTLETIQTEHFCIRRTVLALGVLLTKLASECFSREETIDRREALSFELR